MADFSGVILTNAGRDILAMALAGEELKFSKVKIGDGILKDGRNPQELTDLLSPKMDIAITRINREKDVVRIPFAFTNYGLEEGFFVREIGVFAIDPLDKQEKLYAYAYAENPDFLPAAGSPTAIECNSELIVAVSNAPNVTAVLADSIVFATRDDIALSESVLWSAIHRLELQIQGLAKKLQEIGGQHA